MNIYAIQDSQSGAIKIGVSKDPESRLRSLSTGSAGTLILLHVVPAVDARAAEDRLHTQLEEYRLRSEWFQLPADVLADLRQHMEAAAFEVAPPKQPAPASGAFSQFQESIRAAVRAKRGAQAEIARRLGISTPSVAAYVTGGNRIPAEHLDVVLDVLGAGIDLHGLIRSGPLSPENLTQTDPALGMAAVYSDGVHRIGQMQPADLAATVLGPVPAHLPPDVRHHLDQGRACIAYAGFYYPLLTVGAAQLAMAVEAAIRAYAEMHGIDTKIAKTGRAASMVNLIDRLASAGHFDAHQVRVWRAWSDLRNALMHPGSIQIAPMGLVLPLLTDFTLEFLRLFPAPDQGT